MSAQRSPVPRQDSSVRYVREAPAAAEIVCRCGTHVPRGGPVYRVEGVPRLTAFVFENQSFCSAGCLRAFCLETLESLDGLDTPSSQRVVTDLHQLYQGMAQAFAEILNRTS